FEPRRPSQKNQNSPSDIHDNTKAPPVKRYLRMPPESRKCFFRKRRNFPHKPAPFLSRPEKQGVRSSLFMDFLS
ncbi:hypothetical protein, partial [Roseovarius azorensis]|uniref:hypothetical protein n=1 Tax=Roseovarius azorensis TaxID=1287727 RepID=UPI001C31905B